MVLMIVLGVVYSIVQAISTVIIGVVLGLIFIWKVGLVGLACVPILISTGYIRLVRRFQFSRFVTCIFTRFCSVSSS